MNYKLFVTGLNFLFACCLFAACGYILLVTRSCNHMSKKVRVNAPGDEAPYTQPDPEAADGSDQEHEEEKGELKRLRRQVDSLERKIEAYEFAIMEFDAKKGAKVSLVKKNNEMCNLFYAWMKHATEVQPALKLPEKKTQ